MAPQRASQDVPPGTNERMERCGRLVQRRRMVRARETVRWSCRGWDTVAVIHGVTNGGPIERARECPVCGSALEPAFSATVLRRHCVTYLSCASCGLLKTENPFWLEEAYRTAIVPSDTGVARRNLEYRRLLEPILYSFFGEEGTFLDVAGGYGLLARLLRDIGFDCYTTDKYCPEPVREGLRARRRLRGRCIIRVRGARARRRSASIPRGRLFHVPLPDARLLGAHVRGTAPSGGLVVLRIRAWAARDVLSARNAESPCQQARN